MINVTLPELGENVNEATISFFHFHAGDNVQEGEDLVELTTDKAVFNLPAPCSGVLKEVFFEEGDVVKVGEIIATIEEP